MPFPDAKYPVDQMLVAAAPEMFAALCWVDDWLFATTPASEEVHVIVAKAIAKAEGRDKCAPTEG